MIKKKSIFIYNFRNNRAAIVTLGGLKPLFIMAQSKNLETQRAAAISFYNVSCASGNHIPMVKADVVSVISSLGRVSDLECKRYSIYFFICNFIYKLKKMIKKNDFHI